MGADATDGLQLHGEQIVLVPVGEAHAAALCDIRRHPEVIDWWGELDEGFPWEEPTADRFTVLLDHRVAGMVQVTEERDPHYRSAEVDIFLAADLRGRGIGPDVLRTFIRHLIDERGHHRVFLGTNVHNARAIRCYEKAGFRTVGTMRLAGRDHRTGKYEDELLMEVVEEEAAA